MSGSLHIPQRPEWICRGCQAPWPCQSARGRLLAEYAGTPVALRIFLTDQAAVAAYDARDDPDLAGRLVHRIVGWTDAQR